MIDQEKLCEAIELIRSAFAEHLSERADPKMIDVWHVEYCEADGWPVVVARRSMEQTKTLAAIVRRTGAKCIRITGPHKHEVPA